MKSILSLILLLTFVGIKAQNNLVVFSENGEKFFLIINGVKQNIEAETNVKVTDLIQPNYKAKIVFEDKAKGVVDQNIYFMQGGEPVKNHEFVFSVGIKKKGIYKARPVSAVAIGPQTKSDPEQTVVHYATSEPTQSNNNVISDGGSANTVHVADDGTVVNHDQTITQTKTQTNSTNGENVNVGVNVNGMGVNINVNDNMGAGNGNVSTTTTQTVTSTKTSGGSTVTKSSTTTSSNGGTTKTATENTTTKKQVYTDGYEAGKATPSGCTAMGTTDFDGAKQSIDGKGFDDSKLKVAKQVIDNNCMTSEQVKEIMALFSFEQSKLDFAKYAYGRTTDKNNYYKINDSFTFESSITELDNYIKRSNSGTK